jgi:hypothetical protein
MDKYGLWLKLSILWNQPLSNSLPKLEKSNLNKEYRALIISVAQVVSHLSNKHEALNSNPITTKTKERKKKYKVLEN